MKWYSWSRQDFIEKLAEKYLIPNQKWMELIENGCLGLWDKPTDYILTEWLLDALPTLYQQDEIIYQYNQWTQSWSQKSCTLFTPMGAISDLFNVEIPLKVAEVWDTNSYSKGRVKDSWWYVAMWVDHICKEWNNSEYWKKYWQVAYYSIALKDNALVKWILDKRYTICTWYQWNSKYNNDKNDWVLNWTEFWAATYWHAVGAIWWINSPARIKDNYYKTAKYNIYDVEHEFSEISCFYDRWYVITKVAEDNLERIKKLNKMKSLILNWIPVNSELWHETGSEFHRVKLHDMNTFYREWLDYIEWELKTLV